jgi:hypothetical protein
MDNFEPQVVTEQKMKRVIPKWLFLILLTIAYTLPAAILGYVLYQHYLPLGYQETFTLNVGSQTDTNRGALYLLPSPDLSSRQITPLRTNYRTLSGYADVIFTAPIFLHDALVTVSIDDPTITLTPPIIAPVTDEQQWDHVWDFSRNNFTEFGLQGTAFPFDGSIYFDGDNRLELPNSADLFERGPFTLHLVWTPEDSLADRQQLIGHFNWEIYQNTDSVVFRVGRMDNIEQGQFYSVSQPVADDFFLRQHSLLAVYSPDVTSGNGYIALYVDGVFSGKTLFGTSTIHADYGSMNLTLGKSVHSGSTFYTGSIHRVFLRNDARILNQQGNTFRVQNTDQLYLPLYSSSPQALRSITVTVQQE